MLKARLLYKVMLFGSIGSYKCPARVEPWRTGNPSSGMRARTAQVQAFDWRVVSGPTEYRAKRVELIERVLTVKDVTTGQTEPPLQIHWRQNLPLKNQLVNAGRVSGQSFYNDIPEFFPPRVPVACL